MSTGTVNVEHGPRWDRIQQRALAAAIVGIVTFLVVAFTPLAGPHPLTQAFVSYSVAFNFWFAVPMGCLVVLMIHYLSGGAWGVWLRPIVETGASTLGLVVLFFIPVAVSWFLGASSPYPWARPHDLAVRGTDSIDDLDSRAWLLNPVFAVVRAAAYFTVFLTLSYFLRSWSERWRRGDAAAGRRLPMLSGPGLVAYGIFITFVAIDWVMSIEPFFVSTMYPPIYAISQFDAGFAFTIICAITLAKYPPLRGRITYLHLRDLGGLLLAFIMLWAYFAFAQFLLVWAGNLTDEAPYYLKRMRGGWEYVGITLIVLHFFVPFVLLLFRTVKDNSANLMGVACLVMCICFVETLWWIEPAYSHAEGPGWYWLLDIAAWIGLGGVWLWWFAGRMKHVSLEPVHGPNQCEPAEEVSHG